MRGAPLTLDEIISTPVAPNYAKPTDLQRSWCVPKLTCKDGTTISVQASEKHYCNPRDNDGPWDAVECGYPSVAPGPEMMKYAETPTNPTGTVYAWVPVEVVRAFLAEHGGAA